MNETQLSLIKTALKPYEQLEFSFLFGSRARGNATTTSDWDFAVWISSEVDAMDRLALVEDIRTKLAKTLGTDDDLIQIVDLQRADLSISSTVVDEGIVITGEDTLSLINFYTRIWALVEDFYWYQNHEAGALPPTGA